MHDGLYIIQEKQYEQPKYNLIVNKNFKICVFETPSLFHRFFIRFLLGWSYEKVDN